MNPDNDTQQILTEADHVRSLTLSDGWRLIKAKLDARIIDLQNIANLDMTKIDTLPQQLAARQMAVGMIFDWLKADIYGFIEQQENNNQLLKEKQEDFIGR